MWVKEGLLTAICCPAQKLPLESFWNVILAQMVWICVCVCLGQHPFVHAGIISTLNHPSIPLSPLFYCVIYFKQAKDFAKMVFVCVSI